MIGFELYLMKALLSKFLFWCYDLNISFLRMKAVYLIILFIFMEFGRNSKLTFIFWFKYVHSCFAVFYFIYIRRLHLNKK